MSNPLANKVAIVTGGAAGIGGAAARQLAAGGARVLIVDIDEESAARNATRMVDEGGQALTLVGNVAEEAVAKEMVERAVAEFGRLDILVQNAYGGGINSLGSAVEVDHEGYRPSMTQLVDALSNEWPLGGELLEKLGCEHVAAGVPLDNLLHRRLSLDLRHQARL